MSQSQRASVELNNLLQARGQAHLISWVDIPSGPQNHIIWTVTCKFRGQSIGEARAAHKTTAKEEACVQALRALRGN